MHPDNLTRWAIRVQNFESESHEILSMLEGAGASRVVVLEKSYETLSLLSIKQDDMMRQALRCAENGLYRAAHVMAWAACIDYIEDTLSEDGRAKLRAPRPVWKGRDSPVWAGDGAECNLSGARKAHITTTT